MKNIKGILFALVSSVTFGLIPLFSIPVMQEGLSSISLLFYRFLFSSLMMGGMCLVRRDRFKIPIRHLLAIFLMSLLYAATALFLVFSYNFIPSGIATTIHFIYPVLVSIIMVVFFKEKKSVILIIAAVLSLVGVVFMCWTGEEAIQPIGIFIASLTIVAYAAYIVAINQSKAGRTNAEVLTFYILFFGALIFFVSALFTPQGLQSIPSSESTVRIFLLALLCTLISDLTLVYAIKLVGSTVTSVLGSMEPVVAVLVGVLVFHEHFDWLSLAGILLILFAVIMVIKISTKSSNNISRV